MTDYQHPRRTVENNHLYSSAMPVINIQVDARMTYIGNLKSTIYDRAHIDNYYFVAADEAGNLQTFVWIQFEGYFPHIPEETSYKYPGTIEVKLGELTWLMDGWAGVHDKNREYRPNSDSIQTRDFLQEHDYHWEHGQPYGILRFVQLIGDPPRDEVLVIFAYRDLAMSEPIKLNGSDSPEWAGYQMQLLDKAKSILHSYEP